MKAILIGVIATVGLAASGVAIAQEDLAKSSGCLNCHSVDAKKVGPSFKSIAAKYKDQADATTKIVANFKAGKAHPGVKASDADLESLAKWIVAM